MAKGKTKSPAAKAASSAPGSVDADTSKKVSDLKVEGNQSFARGDFVKALTIYEDAIKLLPSSAPERADFYNNRAACYISQKKYKEAVRECSSALEVQPASLRALQRRAKAYECLAQYKLALKDISTINASEHATADTREAERKLTEKANRALGGAAAGGRNMSPLQNNSFVAKLQMGDDVKLLHLPLNASYAELLAGVQSKFPTAGPAVVKYVDKVGDLVTITARNDLHLALQELATQYQRQQMQNQHGPKLAAAFPPLRLTVVPVASAEDVPKPPQEEELERLQQLNYVQQYLAAQRQQEQQQQQALLANSASASKADGQAGQEGYFHPETWVLDFAQLFTQCTGIDADRYMDLQSLGWDAAQKALDVAIHDEQALPLLDKAKDSFVDVTCTGLCSWGQIHQLSGTRLLDNAVRAGKKQDEVAEAVLAEWEQAEKRLKEALAYKPTFLEALLGIAQLEFERAKLKAGHYNPDTTSKEAKPAEAAEGAEGEAAAAAAAPSKTPEELQAETNAAQRAMLASLEATRVAAAADLVASALSWADRAVEAAPVMDERVKENQQKATELQLQPLPNAEYGYLAQAKVSKGNFLYEWSQMLAASGAAGDWRAQLDAAVALFREAACPEKDIRNALRNHFKTEELDVPPEEEEKEKEEEAKAEPAAAEAEKKAPEAKGLPSLEVKKAKK